MRKSNWFGNNRSFYRDSNDFDYHLWSRRQHFMYAFALLGVITAIVGFLTVAFWSLGFLR